MSSAASTVLPYSRAASRAAAVRLADRNDLGDDGTTAAAYAQTTHNDSNDSNDDVHVRGMATARSHRPAGDWRLAAAVTGSAAAAVKTEHLAPSRPLLSARHRRGRKPPRRGTAGRGGPLVASHRPPISPLPLRSALRPPRPEEQ